MVLDRVPPWVRGRERCLDEVLAQVTRATHQEGQPDQRRPVGAEGLLEAPIFVVIPTHNQYVVRERENVASTRGQSPIVHIRRGRSLRGSTSAVAATVRFAGWQLPLTSRASFLPRSVAAGTSSHSRWR